MQSRDAGLSHGARAGCCLKMRPCGGPMLERFPAVSVVRILAMLVAVGGVIGANHAARGQGMGLAGPSSAISTGYSEQFSITGLSGLGPVLPPFGGYDPSADARIGLSLGGAGLTITAGQGSRRTMVSQTPVLVVPDGGTGSFFSGEMRPFVTGIVPVVGYGGASPVWADDNYGTPAGPSDLRTTIARWQAAGSPMGPTRDRLKADEVISSRSESVVTQTANARVASSAERGDQSVAAIQATMASEKQQRDRKVEALVAKGSEAERRGQWEEAVHYYRRAQREARGARRAELGQTVRNLESRFTTSRP